MDGDVKIEAEGILSLGEGSPDSNGGSATPNKDLGTPKAVSN